jgi:hypothetical protein
MRTGRATWIQMAVAHTLVNAIGSQDLFQRDSEKREKKKADKRYRVQRIDLRTRAEPTNETERERSVGDGNDGLRAGSRRAPIDDMWCDSL